MSSEFVPMEHRVAFRETEESGSSLPCRRLRGQKGGPDCNWALARLRNAGEVLFFLNLLEPVALSDKAKKGMYRKFARLVDMRTKDEALAVLIWFAGHGGLDSVHADRLYDRAARIFRLEYDSDAETARRIWGAAGGTLFVYGRPLKDREGKNMFDLKPFYHPNWLDRTYPKMYSLRQKFR